MKRKKYRILLIFALFVSIASPIAPVNASAADSAAPAEGKGSVSAKAATANTNSVRSGDFVYSITRGRATITVYNGKEENLSIPDSIDGYPVAGIGPAAFLLCGALTTVTIPPGVTSIGAQAFDSCINLRSVDIPDGVAGIGERAFAGCVSLTSITIPESAATVGKLTFLECAGLREAVILNRSVSGGMFANCTSLSSVSFGDNVISVGGESFFNCKSLATLNFPESVAIIGDGAFFGCTGLSDVIFHSPNTDFEGDIGNYHKNDTTVPTFSETGNLFTIYAFEGSLAYKYAMENEMEFVPLASVEVDGLRLKFDVPPIIVDDRTLVPMRAIFEALGARVDWDDETRTVTASASGKTIVMRIGDAQMTVDGAAVDLDVPPMILFDRTLVPVRAVSESFGATVDWDEATYNVIISYADIISYTDLTPSVE